MEPNRTNHDAPRRLSPDAALAGILALLIEAREARPAEERPLATEALLARAGLTDREIGLATGEAPDTIDARLRADGPALWRTLQRRRAAPAEIAR
jgi:hypothetical protein